MIEKPKALIHLGAGEMQIPGIQIAVKLGLHVVTTDQREAAPGARFSHEHWVISVADVDALILKARNLALTHDIVGAYATSDLGVHSVVKITEALGLRGNSVASVEACIDKSKALTVWRRLGISVPRGEVLDLKDEALAKIGAMGFPLIVKPADSCGSQGVLTVSTPESLRAALAEAGRFSRMVIVEEFVDGRHIDVNGMFLDGAFKPVGMMDRFFTGAPHHLPQWGCLPCHLDDESQSQVYDLLERAARALGIDHGPVKGDVIWAARGPVLLEIAPRFHGDVSTQFLPTLAAGIHPAAIWLSHLANLPPPEAACHSGLYAGWHALFASGEGVVRSIRGMHEAHAVPGVVKIYLMRAVGEMVAGKIDNRSMCGFVWATASDAESLRNTLHKATSLIEIETQPLTHEHD